MISSGTPGDQAPVINRNSTGSLSTGPAHRLLLAECSNAESIMRSIVNQSFAAGDSKPSLDESPLKPWIIEMANTLIILRTKTTACGLTVQSGEGILLKRQPSPHPTLIKWSAPLFIRIKSKGAGMLFGSQTRSVFAVCTTRQLEDMLLRGGSGQADAGKTKKPGSRTLRGMEFAMSCGAGFSDRSDMLAVTFGERLDLVSASQTAGPIFGVAFLSGVMELDAEKNAEVYGDVRPMDILNTLAPPAEFQPIYGEMNRIVNRVERLSSVSRASASLERFSTGRDPDSVIVLSDGSTVT